ncbi:BrnA antitoxin family protein [Litorivivens sp.]|uniref:BrnA antitoxin family protein n=1 Tax=Litorivivens sp. TaxID=2020868 RepID=UPI0035615625
MSKRPDPEKTDAENPEWTEEMFANAQRGTAASRRGPGRPAGSNKVSTTIRFDRDIIEAFQKDGAGWQSRMNDALRDWLRTH